MNATLAARVLIIEDDPTCAELLETQLMSLGCRTRSTRSVEFALPMLRTQSFDLIVLDNVLPGLMGISALPEITSRTKAPVIVISAFRTPRIEDDALTLGAKAYLDKPINPEELSRKVRELLSSA